MYELKKIIDFNGNVEIKREKCNGGISTSILLEKKNK